jgi:hypothetical protein
MGRVVRGVFYVQSSEGGSPRLYRLNPVSVGPC